MKTITNSILESLSSKKLVEASTDSPMGLLGQALDTATSMGWSYDDINYAGDETGYEFYQYSPAGEDFSFTASCGGADLSDDEKGKNLIKDIVSYADDFDEDEHLEMWIEARGNGVGGVPGTRELVKDAEDIHSMLNALADELKKINNPMNESYVYNWKDDVEDIEATEENDDLWYAVAENIVDKDEYGEYKDRDRDDSIYEVMSNIINLFKISKRSRLYKYLLKWYGSEEELLKKVRDVYETNDAIYFVTGSGYSLFDADLLGGNADGETEREFNKFVDKEEGLNEGALEPEYSGRKSFYGKAHVNDSDGGGKTLRSYETDIMTIKDGKIKMLCQPEHLTQTTLRHIREFLQQNGMEPLTKKQLVDLISKEGMTESAKVKLTEAPEDISEEEQEYELVDNAPEEMPAEEEMSDTEYEEEAEDDAKETVKDDIEEPWYATTPELDELRDILPDLDYRLFLINDNMICVGRLNGPDIEFLTSNAPSVKDEAEVSEANDKAEEVEERAEENEEDSFEYMWIKAPDTFDKFVNQVNVVYLSPEMSEEDKEQYAGVEGNHESLMNYLMNELPEDKREEYKANQIEEETPTDETIEEPIEEPIEVEEEPIEVEEETEEEKEEK